MPDANTNIPADSSYNVTFDDDDNDASAKFTIGHDGSATLWEVSKVGDVACFGPIVHTNNSHNIVGDPNYGSPTWLISFRSNGTEMAALRGDHVLNVARGVRIQVVTSDPNGSLSGYAGQLVAYNASGTWKLCSCVADASTTWKKSAAFT